MVKGLWVLEIGEFGWQLMNGQARARYVARTGGYDHVVVCTTPTAFDLYRDFAHEFITHDYPGEPLCQHRRINRSSPRICTSWFKLYGCKEYEPYKAKGYDVLFPPEEKPDVRTTSKEQDFIKFGKFNQDLAYDMVFHVRTRAHTGSNNWATPNWVALAERLLAHKLKMATVGLIEGSGSLPGVEDKRGVPLHLTMDIMASSKLVVGSSSGPICLASLCGTPHLVWYGGKRYVGATMGDRFKTLWNPLNTRCWPLSLGWQPSVDNVYQHIMLAWKEVQDAKKSTACS